MAIGDFIRCVNAVSKDNKTSDYIKRQDAIDYLVLNMCWYDEDGYSVDEESKRREIISDLIDGVSAADVAPVRHGRWEQVEVTEAKRVTVASMFCPVCKRWHSEVYFYGNPIERVNYCNHCGAKMDNKPLPF